LWRLGPQLKSQPEPEFQPEFQPEPEHDAKIIRRGNIRIRNMDDGTVLGYVASFVSAGQFFIQDISKALAVSFEKDLTGSGTQFNLVPEVGFGSP
jgi:hypothetical protein